MWLWNQLVEFVSIWFKVSSKFELAQTSGKFIATWTSQTICGRLYAVIYGIRFLSINLGHFKKALLVLFGWLFKSLRLWISDYIDCNNFSLLCQRMDIIMSGYSWPVKSKLVEQRGFVKEAMIIIVAFRFYVCMSWRAVHIWP